MRRLSCFVFGLILLLASTGCSRRTVAPIVEPVVIHDTTETVLRVHDSTYIDRWHTQWLNGDTVFIHDSLDRWHSVKVHDTLSLYREVPVLQKVYVDVPAQLTGGQKFLIRAGWLMVAVILFGIGYFVSRLWRKK